MFTCITWNIEGLNRNIHSLKHFADQHKPDLVFLSEPQVFQCDVNSLLRTFHGQFSHHLNSEDLHQPDLALNKTKAKGGTMVLQGDNFKVYFMICIGETFKFHQQACI